MNKKVLAMAFVATPLALVFLIAGLVAIMAAIYTRDIRAVAVFTDVGCMACAITIVASFLKFVQLTELTKREPEARPVVRWWCHNGVTAVCTEEDYQLWWREHERYEYLKGLLAMPVPHAENRPAPKFTMFFSDRSLIPSGSDWPNNLLWSPDDWKTGDDGHCTKLLIGCRVEKTELFVPRNSFQWRQGFTAPVSLEAAWKLVHGPNAKPTDPV